MRYTDLYIEDVILKGFICKLSVSMVLEELVEPVYASGGKITETTAN